MRGTIKHAGGNQGLELRPFFTEIGSRPTRELEKGYSYPKRTFKHLAVAIFFTRKASLGKLPPCS
jgi:hypothetical protein